MNAGIPKVSSVDLRTFRDERGNLTVIEYAETKVHFRRIYYVTGVPDGVFRGDHAHYRTNQLLIAAHGKLTVEHEDGFGCSDIVKLCDPAVGLFVPAGVWSRIVFHDNAVMVVLADRPYLRDDYIFDKKAFYRWKRNMVFHGVYKSFDEAPAHGSSDCASWIDRQVWSVVSRPRSAHWPENTLAHLVTNYAADRILDWGGSLGATYQCLLKLVGFRHHLIYDIVETPKTVEAATKLYANVPHFYTEIPQKQYDIIFSQNAIQYASDWAAVVAQWAAVKPQFIVGAGMLLSDAPSFVTIQNWFGEMIPVWFINRDEFLSQLPEYELCSEVRARRVNMANFPEELRIRCTKNLMLRRKSC